jgi:hypothetical protein
MERTKPILWQPDVPNLSDDRFASQNELNASTYPVPEELFDALRSINLSIDSVGL